MYNRWGKIDEKGVVVVGCGPVKSLLQSRLSLPPQGGADPLGGVGVGPVAVPTAGGEQLAAHLAHALLLLHGDEVLLLGVGEGEGHADQQGRHGHGPGGAAAEQQRRLDDVGRRLELVPDPAACGRRDYVAQREEAVAERLLLGVEVAVGGDFGVCNRKKSGQFGGSA